MASFIKRGKRWRAQIRSPKLGTINKTFDTKADAQRWAARIEGDIDEPGDVGVNLLFSDMVDRYLDELETHKPPGRTKRATLEMLRRYLGDRRSSQLTAETLVNFARDRSTYCSPATVQQDMIYLRGLLHTAKTIWGARVNMAAYDSAATHCKRYGLTGRSIERDRRPSSEELKLLLTHIEANNYYRSPMGDIVRFAIETCMRLSEILNLRWDDLDTVKKTMLIRSRKHPSQKVYNDQVVPLLGDAYKLIQKQPRKGEIIFPYQPKAVGTAFRRACQKLNIEDLHFHDLRHEGISRLFERGYSVMEVAKVSGHRDINQLRRYVQLKPEDLHQGPSGNRQEF